MCPSLNNEFLDDVSKAVAFTITRYRIDIVAAKGTHFPRAAGEEISFKFALASAPPSGNS